MSSLSPRTARYLPARLIGFRRAKARTGEEHREIMEILEAYDLTGSYRASVVLAGCDHHTVARYVKMREAGQSPTERKHRDRAIDAFLPRIEESVVRSNGRIRADIVHERLQAIRFTGGERTTRRTVVGQRRSTEPAGAGSTSPG